MKGIIAEINGSNMIVIAKNGDFIKCRKLPNCNIGEEVNIPARNMSAIYKRISTVAASFVILAMLSTGVYAYYTPYSYVSVDINPSLELYVNRFDRVIGVHAFNEDAQKLLDSAAGVKNKGIDTALEQIIDEAAYEGYLKQNEENSVMIVVSSNSKKEEASLSKKISKSSTEALAKISSSYEVILEKTKVETYKNAKKDNVSPGKVILANEFKEVKPEINEEEIKRMPLQQAIKEIEKTEGDEKDKDDSKPKDKPKAAAIVESPKSKSDQKNNVMNVKELIKDKNEELGKKLEQNQKDKNKSKDKDKESFNQNNNGSTNNKENNSTDKEQKDKEKADKDDDNVDDNNNNEKEDNTSDKEDKDNKDNVQDSKDDGKKNK